MESSVRRFTRLLHKGRALELMKHPSDYTVLDYNGEQHVRHACQFMATATEGGCTVAHMDQDHGRLPQHPSHLLPIGLHLPHHLLVQL